MAVSQVLEKPEVKEKSQKKDCVVIVGAGFAGFNAAWIYCRRRDQLTAACKRTRRSLFARLVRKSLGCG